ncbi:hypothetical protein BGZ95_004322 [Linnemannia exigua]|uniref:Uncharacterized protein n=1 Tax=Linnemannia exigua TaxID=604196 RepID=A0AAD4DJ59_9FUNG|nr:hypothetical protein BGZ95_004322 [Linnemannia exigua]
MKLPEAINMFSRQSRIFRKAFFGNSLHIVSGALCFVLIVCESLGEFSMEMNSTLRLYDGVITPHIKLDDAMYAPWSYTRLRRLETIWPGTAPDVFTRQDFDGYTFFGGEEGIGLLIQVIYLDLRASAMNEKGISGRPGCLERSDQAAPAEGSVHAHTDDTKLTMGWPEAK